MVLFLRGHDRQQVSSTHATMLLCCLPALPLAEVTVAEALKLLPARFAHLPVWSRELRVNDEAVI